MFAVGRAAAAGAAFRGPRWIVLAQCSTLAPATWPLWATLLARSRPHVRGILAYEESAPAPGPSAELARDFVDLSAGARGLPLLAAWERVNRTRGRKWAAIVHKEAVNDRLSSIAATADFSDVFTSDTTSSYLGFSDGRPGELRQVGEPFELRIHHSHRGADHEIRPDTLHSPHAELDVGRWYTIELTAPPPDAFTTVRLRLVHNRSTYPKQPAWSRIFRQVQFDHDLSGAGQDTPTLVIEARRPAQRMLVGVRCGALAASGLERHHSYLWLRAQATLRSGRRLSHDFTTKGLHY
jgi:hypothetical protein